MFLPLDGQPDAKYELRIAELDKVCTNIHNKVIKIDDNLFMAGFGGSLPAYQNNAVKWQGYPYNNNDEYSKDFAPFIENIVVKTINDEKMKENNIKNSIILFTHNGPSDCSTTIDWRDQNVGQQIFMGCDAVRDAILSESIVKFLIDIYILILLFSVLYAFLLAVQGY